MTIGIKNINILNSRLYDLKSKMLALENLKDNTTDKQKKELTDLYIKASEIEEDLRK